MTGPQVDRRRRIFLGVFTSAAVLAVTHQPLDFTIAQADAVRPATVSGVLPVAEMGSGTGERRLATDPGCYEDEAAVVVYDPDPTHGLTWVCVAIDDFADEGSQDRLEEMTR